MKSNSVVDSSDIGNRMQELAKEEGRCPMLPLMDETDAAVALPGGDFPKFVKLQDAPRDVNGIVLYKSGKSWEFSNVWRHCMACDHPNNCKCIGSDVAYWAPK